MGETQSNTSIKISSEPRQSLPGEKLVFEASNVVKESIYEPRDQERAGRLCVTNFRISFLPDQETQTPEPLQRNKLVDHNDIVFYNIDAVLKVSKKKKKKKLALDSSSLSRVRCLEIHCKVAVHILKLAFPTCMKNMFAYSYRPEVNCSPERADVVRFSGASDWTAVLQRLNATGFRVVECNTQFKRCSSLPECFVVPKSMSEADITNIVQRCINNRCPVWSYTHSNRASLLRIGCCLPGVPSSETDSWLKHIARSRAAMDKNKVAIYDLDLKMMSLSEVRLCHEGLRQICMPGSLKSFWSSDSTWSSALESTGWMRLIGGCLEAAAEVVRLMLGWEGRESLSVALREESSTDWSPLVSCLVQLLLDPHARTLAGFQTLVEREWVALGHRFADRYSLTETKNAEQCPLFLIFLDCVHQLLLQFPSAFEFTQIYLTTLWDSLCLGLFRTFLFNSARDAAYFTPDQTSGGGGVARNPSAVGLLPPVAGLEWTPLADGGGAYKTGSRPERLASAWDWSVQFDEDRQSLFSNPLFVVFNGGLLGGVVAAGGVEDLVRSPGGVLSGIDSDAQRLSSRISENFETPVCTVRDDFVSVDSADQLDAAESPALNRKSRSGAIADSGLLQLDESIRIDSLDERKDSAKSTTSTGSLKIDTNHISIDSPRSDTRSFDDSTDIFDAIKRRRDPLKALDMFDYSEDGAVVLFPRCLPPALRPWSLCYLRWLTPAEVQGGGEGCEYLIQCLIVEEILHLQSSIAEHRAGRKLDRRKSALIFGTAMDGGSPSGNSQGNFGAGNSQGNTGVGNSQGNSGIKNFQKGGNSAAVMASPRKGASLGRGVVTSSFPFFTEASRSRGGQNYMDEFFRSSVMFPEGESAEEEEGSDRGSLERSGEVAVNGVWGKAEEY